MDAGEVAALDDKAPAGNREFYLNIGPHHVSTHGLLRCIAALDGEEIKSLDLEIGYHHRATKRSASGRVGTNISRTRIAMTTWPAVASSFPT